MVLFVRLPLAVLPFQCLLAQLVPNKPQQLRALPWSLHLQPTSWLRNMKKNSSPGTIKCSTDLPSPGTAAYSPYPAAIPRAKSPAHGQAQITLQSQSQETP